MIQKPCNKYNIISEIPTHFKRLAAGVRADVILGNKHWNVVLN